MKANSTIHEQHIPSIGLHNFIEESEKTLIELSKNDDEKRKFTITIHLEDLRARTQFVQIDFDREISFNTTDQDGDAIDHWLQKTEENFLSSILIRVQKSSAQKAITASNGIFPMLSMLTYKLQKPINIRNIVLRDLKHSATWATPPSLSQRITITQMPLSSFVHENPFGAMFALYREGMNSVSEPYRFLCYFKILEAYKKGKPPFNTRTTRPKIKVTTDLLGDAYIPEFHDDFLGNNVKNCFDKLADLRDVIAHPYKNRETEKKFQFINIDHPSHLAEIGAKANLLERMVARILNNELELQAPTNQSIKQLLDNLKNVTSP